MTQSDHDERERIWPTPLRQEEYRRRFPDQFARYDYALRFVGHKRVLDCACGTGYGSWLLSAAGAIQVVGVDVDPETIQWATQHFLRQNTEFRLFAGERLPVADGEFEQAVSLETIEHIEDPAAFVAELARSLVPGGGLFLSTPLTYGPTRLKPQNQYHLREFDDGELEALLSPHFIIRERLGQQSQTAARFAELKRAPLLGPAVRAGFHRKLPKPVRALARAWLGRSSADQQVWITNDGWQEAPVQIVVAEKRRNP